jgi:hypothetical protein
MGGGKREKGEGRKGKGRKGERRIEKGEGEKGEGRRPGSGEATWAIQRTSAWGDNPVRDHAQGGGIITGRRGAA